VVLYEHISDLSSIDANVIEKIRDRWHHLQSAYNRANKKMKEWKTKPSGSAAKKGRQPTHYKYASDMSFLKTTLTSAATTDNIELEDENATPAASVQVE